MQKKAIINFSLVNKKIITPSTKLSSQCLDLVSNTTFLGIIVDTKLQWGSHICLLDLVQQLMLLKFFRQLTDIDTARLVHFAYFHSVISYEILLWGNWADIKTIFILQKRAVRYIYKLESRTFLRDKSVQYTILTTVYQYINTKYLIHVHKNIVNFLKIVICQLGILVAQISCTYWISGSVKRVCFTGIGIKSYNKLPNVINSLPLYQFKKIIKCKLIQKTYYTLDEYLTDKKAWT